MPLIVESMAQLHDCLCRTITQDWDSAHAVALKAALDAHMHTTAGQAGHTTAMDMLKGLLKMAQFMTGMPNAQAGTATPNDMEVDVPASPMPRPALPVSSERLRAAVLESARALDCGCGLAAIAALEAAVLTRFAAATWHELTDSCSSLVQLLQADAALMEAVTGGPDAVAMVPLEQMLQVVAQALVCSGGSAVEPSQEDTEGECLDAGSPHAECSSTPYAAQAVWAAVHACASFRLWAYVLKEPNSIVSHLCAAHMQLQCSLLCKTLLRKCLSLLFFWFGRCQADCSGRLPSHNFPCAPSGAAWPWVSAAAPSAVL